jgi:hydrogenase nickel incorporation protein HypA/HybF
MHELGIAMDVVDVVTERARGARVKRIVLEIGALTAVLPDALLFCFDLATEGTPIAGAALEILQIPAKARCRACSAEFELTRPFGRCICGSTDLDFLTGDEFRVFEMEVE